MHTQTNDSSQHSQSRPKVIFKRKATRSRNLHSFIPIESTRYATNYISSFQGTKDNSRHSPQKRNFRSRGLHASGKKKKNILLPHRPKRLSHRDRKSRRDPATTVDGIGWLLISTANRRSQQRLNRVDFASTTIISHWWKIHRD